MCAHAGNYEQHNISQRGEYRDLQHARRMALMPVIVAVRVRVHASILTPQPAPVLRRGLER